VDLIAIVLVGFGVLLGVGVLLSRADGGLHDEPLDHADLGMPDRPLTADDIAGLRFRTGMRGYRMEDVDAALERITASLRGPVPAAVPVESEPTEPTEPPRLKPARTVRRAPKASPE
jgi:DivIVA domain-containing protein